MWLRLTGFSGSPVVVSLKNVCEFASEASHTVVYFMNGTETDIRESVDEIAAMLNAVSVSDAKRFECERGQQ